MQHYLFEDPIPLGGSLALAAGLLFAAYFHSRTAWQLYLAVILFVSSGTTFGLDWLVVTKVETVDAFLDQLVDSCKRNDANNLIAAISPDYDFNGINHRLLSDVIRREFKSLRLSSLKLNGRKIKASKTNASAEFVAVLSGTYNDIPVDYYVLRLLVHVQFDGAQWRIYRMQRFDPVNAREEISLIAR